MSPDALQADLLTGMMRAAGKGAVFLGKSSSKLVRKFFLSQQNPDGGFRDRSGRSDLYYTVFGLAGVAACSPSLLQAAEARGRAKRVGAFVEGFGDGAALDMVHLCSLARAWAALKYAGWPPADALTGTLLRRVESLRSEDGGYHHQPGNKYGTAYGAFLACGAYQDLSQEIPFAARLAESLGASQTAAGAWTNLGPGAIEGATNATAAALAVLRQLNQAPRMAAQDWLLGQAHPQGGFKATPGAPLPDLLSTATALHALAGLGVPLDPLREKTLDFIDSLWVNEGGFHGHWGDDLLDCEYTFYGLLALGHLV